MPLALPRSSIRIGIPMCRRAWVRDTDGSITDNIQLSPGMYRTFEFIEDKPGSWLVHCHFGTHMEGGMMARYEVAP